MHEKICERVFLVGGSGFSDSSDCLCYALDPGAPVLIDCGCGPGWTQLRQNIRSTGLDPDHLHTLILTHAHVDHIGAAPAVAADTGCTVVAHELEILGTHGMQAHRYGDMLAMITSGKLRPGKLIGRTVTLEESLKELENMDSFSDTGVTVIDRF